MGFYLLQKCTLVPVESDLLDLLLFVKVDDVEKWKRDKLLVEQILVHVRQVCATAIVELHCCLRLQEEAAGTFNGIQHLLLFYGHKFLMRLEMLEDRGWSLDVCGRSDVIDGCIAREVGGAGRLQERRVCARHGVRRMYPSNSYTNTPQMSWCRQWCSIFVAVVNVFVKMLVLNSGVDGKAVVTRRWAIASLHIIHRAGT